MSAANIRLANKEQSLSSVAKKVLDAVPLTEAWTIQFIYQELARQGQHIEARIIGGCLDDLVGIGLVRQPQTGRYQRIAYKESRPVELKAVSSEDRAVVTTSPSELSDPLSALAKLSSDLRRMAGEIDEAALAMAQKVQEAKQGSEKLHQLQALLKSIGAG